VPPIIGKPGGGAREAGRAVIIDLDADGGGGFVGGGAAQVAVELVGGKGAVLEDGAVGLAGDAALKHQLGDGAGRQVGHGPAQLARDGDDERAAQRLGDALLFDDGLAGLQADDVVERVNRQRVDDVDVGGDEGGVVGDDDV
jgi:hypothetical protein